VVESCEDQEEFIVTHALSDQGACRV
jgi:hypothetical protein